MKKHLYRVEYKIGLSTHEYYVEAEDSHKATKIALKSAKKDAKDYIDETPVFKAVSVLSLFPVLR